MTKPISPDEVVAVKEKIIPKEVIEAFNEIISKNWNGTSSMFKQKDIVNLILTKMNEKIESITSTNDMESIVFAKKYIYENKLLDIEPIYENNGWDVYYNKPALYETYEPTFRFSRKK